MDANFTNSSESPKFIKNKTFIHPQDMDNYEYDSDGFRLPGIIETHIHGAFNYDFSFSSSEEIEKMLDLMLINGITGIVPTIISCSEEQRLQAIRNIVKVYKKRSILPLVHGIYLEGPFISIEKHGSHPVEHLLLPSVELFEKWQKVAEGLIKIVTVAPELPGAVDFIKAMKGQGIIVSLGHSNADWKSTQEAIDAGATHVTHLFNAMPSISHREPNLLSCIISNRDINVEIIADCQHIAPEICKMIFNVYKNDKIIIVSDAIPCTEIPDGKYNIYGQVILKNDNKALLENGKFFGGSLLLNKCLLRLNKTANLSWGQLGMAVWRNPCDLFNIELPDTEVFFDKQMSWLASRQGQTWFYKS